MKVENDLRTMSSFLQVQLKDIKTLVESNKIDQAKENLKFVQGDSIILLTNLKKSKVDFMVLLVFSFVVPTKYQMI